MTLFPTSPQQHDPGDTTPPCQRNDPDLWFSDRPAELKRAKQLCQGCQLRSECLRGALARREPWGVWGGEIIDRGVVVDEKRPRGRPPHSGPF